MKLRYFEKSEFREWWPRMSPLLLRLLDVFRHHWGYPIRISPAPGALGRSVAYGYPGYGSQHNAARWGEVRAVDIMPDNLRRQTVQDAVDLATDVGFTGIGYYPHWSPAQGLHLDVRYDRTVGDPALWGAVTEGGKQKYVSLQEALENAPK